MSSQKTRIGKLDFFICGRPIQVIFFSGAPIQATFDL